MSIVTLNKAYLIMQKSQKRDFLTQLQEASLVHICNIRKTKISNDLFCPTDIVFLKEAIQYLKDTPEYRRPYHEVEIDSKALVSKILETRQKIIESEESILKLTQQIDALAPWGDFDISKFKQLNEKNYNLFFYEIEKKSQVKIDSSMSYQLISEDKKTAYVVVIAQNKPDKKIIGSGKLVELPKKSLKALKKELELTYERQENLREKRRFFTKYLIFLQKVVEKVTHETTLLQAIESDSEHEYLCLLEVYVTLEKTSLLEDFCRAQKVALIYHAPDKTDTPPTLLKTSRLLNAGETLTEFYQIPGYRTIDPSQILFFSFPLFFAIIASDAGYGLILLIISLFTMLSSKGSSLKNLLNLFIMISLATLFFGILGGSYFGFTLDHPFLSKIQILDLRDFDFMMKFSIAIGFIHIAIANLWVLLFSRDRSYQIKSMSFLMILLGIILYVIALKKVAIVFFITSILVLFFFGNPNQSHSIGSYFMNRVTGVLQISKVISLFSDVMSYMRLFALSLAGSSLGATFNKLAMDVIEAIPGVGIIVAIILLFFGHGLNFLLALISGLVHGLRLNYIEFFNWSIEEEGVKFQYFSKSGGK